MLAMGAIVMGFQNCGSNSLQYQDLEAQATEDFFNYPYKSAPRFYAESLLYRQTSSVESFRQFKFFGAVAYLGDPSYTVQYSVRVESLTGEPMCPLYEGALEPGQTKIEFDCVSALDSDSARVLLSVAAGGEEYAVEKIYQP